MKIALGLTFPGNLKDEAVICNICKNYDINLNIIEASFSFQKGWAFLEIEGAEAELDKTFNYLRDKGIHIEKMEKGV